MSLNGEIARPKHFSERIRKREHVHSFTFLGFTDYCGKSSGGVNAGVKLMREVPLDPLSPLPLQTLATFSPDANSNHDLIRDNINKRYSELARRAVIVANLIDAVQRAEGYFSGSAK